MIHWIVLVALFVIAYFAFPPWDNIPGKIGKRLATYIALAFLLWIGENTNHG